jgi:hypothetical protein
MATIIGLMLSNVAMCAIAQVSVRALWPTFYGGVVTGGLITIVSLVQGATIATLRARWKKRDASIAPATCRVCSVSGTIPALLAEVRSMPVDDAWTNDHGWAALAWMYESAAFAARSHHEIAYEIARWKTLPTEETFRKRLASVGFDGPASPNVERFVAKVREEVAENQAEKQC